MTAFVPTVGPPSANVQVVILITLCVSMGGGDGGGGEGGGDGGGGEGGGGEGGGEGLGGQTSLSPVEGLKVN